MFSRKQKEEKDEKDKKRIKFFLGFKKNKKEKQNNFEKTINTNKDLLIEEEPSFSDSSNSQILINNNQEKIILLIGRTGNGKSTLANVLVNKNKQFEEVFKESGDSTSQTREIQNEKFIENNIIYRVVDTVGLEDTLKSRNEVLDKIAEAVYLAREGIHQIFFVISVRFDAKEMANYNLLRSIIFDNQAVDYTTIIRTRFTDFKNLEKCQNDLIELKQESELLKGIIESCQERILHVDNPFLNLLPADNEGEEKRRTREKKILDRKTTRSHSRKVLTQHLEQICQSQESFYQPDKLKNLSADLAEIIEQKKDLEKKLQELKEKCSPISSPKLERINPIATVVSDSFSIFDSETKIIEEITNDSNSPIIRGIGESKSSYSPENTRKLESEREILEEAIEKKQNLIRERVFKHVLNNAENLTKEFLDNITDDGQDWTFIHSDFTLENKIKWLQKEFKYRNVQRWQQAFGNDFQPELDAAFCAWLRDDKKLAPSSLPTHDLSSLRSEYEEWLTKINQGLNEISEQGGILKENWIDLHEDFGKKIYDNSNETYQHSWEKKQITYSEARDWIRTDLITPQDDYFVYYLKKDGYQPNDLKQVNLFELRKKSSWQEIHRNFNFKHREKWGDMGFDYQDAKEWINAGADVNDDEFVAWLRDIKKETLEWVMAYRDDYQILSERFKQYGLCPECQQPYTGEQWCRDCNSKHSKIRIDQFAKSGSSQIDKFIQKYQIAATEANKFLEWIPYEQIINIEYLAEGGFSKVYRAKWVKGNTHHWDRKNIKWIREKDENKNYREIVLKSLTNSQANTDFLDEAGNHKLIDDWSNNIVPFYGLSQDPQTGNYLMVMKYLPERDLRNFLRKNNKQLSLLNKFNLLVNIAQGIKTIHQKNLVHRDFHSGNILKGIEQTSCLITDLGLCKPADQISQNEKIFGVLPYVAPEVLQGQFYTQASDIYSFGIVAYELLTGLPPYYDRQHDVQLGVAICQGLRPVFNIVIPELLEDLINKCWANDPIQRPTAYELEKALRNWQKETDYYWNARNKNDYDDYEEIKEGKFIKQLQKAESHNQNLPLEVRFPNYQIHYDAVYHSKLLPTKEITSLIQKNEINIDRKYQDFKETINSILNKSEELEKIIADDQLVISEELKETLTKIKELKAKAQAKDSVYQKIKAKKQQKEQELAELKKTIIANNQLEEDDLEDILEDQAEFVKNPNSKRLERIKKKLLKEISESEINSLCRLQSEITNLELELNQNLEQSTRQLTKIINNVKISEDEKRREIGGKYDSWGFNHQSLISKGDFKNASFSDDAFSNNKLKKNPENSITFAPQKWLVDQEIEFALQNIEQQFPNRHIFITPYEFMLARSGFDELANARLFSELSRSGKENKKLVFIPINNPNIHWSLLIYEAKNNKFYHLDSSKQKLNQQYIKDMVDHLCQHKDADFAELNVPLQSNSYDCGIYLITFTKLLSANPDLLRTEFPEIDSNQERKFWASIISNYSHSASDLKNDNIRTFIAGGEFEQAKFNDQDFTENNSNKKNKKKEDLYLEFNDNPVFTQHLLSQVNNYLTAKQAFINLRKETITLLQEVCDLIEKQTLTSQGKYVKREEGSKLLTATLKIKPISEGMFGANELLIESISVTFNQLKRRFNKKNSAIFKEYLERSDNLSELTKQYDFLIKLINKNPHYTSSQQIFELFNLDLENNPNLIFFNEEYEIYKVATNIWKDNTIITAEDMKDAIADLTKNVNLLERELKQERKEMSKLSDEIFSSEMLDVEQEFSISNNNHSLISGGDFIINATFSSDAFKNKKLEQANLEEQFKALIIQR